MLETDIYCTRYAWCSVPTNACREVAISSLATLAVVLAQFCRANGRAYRPEKRETFTFFSQPRLRKGSCQNK